MIPKLFSEVPRTANSMELELFLEDVVVRAVKEGLCPAGKQVVCAVKTHQPALAEAGVAVGTSEAEVPLIRFKVSCSQKLGLCSCLQEPCVSFSSC